MRARLVHERRKLGERAVPVATSPAHVRAQQPQPRALRRPACALSPALELAVELGESAFARQDALEQRLIAAVTRNELTQLTQHAALAFGALGSPLKQRIHTR